MNAYAGVVILYYPENDVIANIRSYGIYLQQVYIFDNSEKRNENLVREIMAIPNTAYFHDGENKGIAARLNQAAAQAHKENYSWLLTMDQDSSFSSAGFSTYMDCMHQYQRDTSVAMIGVEHEKQLHIGAACSAVPISRLITSGSFLNLHIWVGLGGFDELLFIDEVDLEYCYRSGIAGYKVLKFTNIQLIHNLGKVSLHRSLKDFTVTTRTLHSPVRIYYMVRNHLYVKRRYDGYFKDDLRTSRNDLINRIKNNLLYGKSRLLLIKYIFQAFSDFNQRKMGKKAH